MDFDSCSPLSPYNSAASHVPRRRKSDFLLDILQRQGTNQARPWLTDLVKSIVGSGFVLPVECEILLIDAFCQQSEDEHGDHGKKRKARELVHLQTLQHPAGEAALYLQTLPARPAFPMLQHSLTASPRQACHPPTVSLTELSATLQGQHSKQ